MKLKTRRYIYGICLATGPLLVSYGLISDNEWPLFASLAGAIIAPGLALQNLGGGEADDHGGKHAAE